MIEHASDIRGVLVVTRNEGTRLGTVTGVNIDPATRQVSAIRFRRNRASRRERYVPIEEVEIVGRDIVLVASETSARDLGIEKPGRRLEDLQGARITRLDGTYVGTLRDIDFSETDWRISDLLLEDGRRIRLDGAEFTIGDEILVPVGSVMNVEETPGGQGMLARLIGEDALDNLRRTFRRALGTH